MSDLASGSRNKANPALVSDELRPQVGFVVDDIVKCIDRDLPGTVERHGFSSGHGGAVLVHTFLGMRDGGERHRMAVEKYIETLADGTSDRCIASLYSGSVGSAWIMDFAGSLLGVEYDLDEMDAFLLSLLDAGPWRGGYDLVSGLVGVGVYALERALHGRTRKLLGMVIRRLTAMAQPCDNGWHWFTPHHHLEQREQALYPNGSTNLGLAHGQWGCIWLLSHGVALGIADKLTERVLEGAVAFMERRIEDVSGHWCLPCWDGIYRRRGPRLAWCYNELGAGFVLALAGRLTGREPWIARGIEIAGSTLGWTPSSDTKLDASICHGTAGIGHIYRRFAQEFGGDGFAAAGNTWLTRTLDFHRPGEKYGGFFHYRHAERDGELAQVFSPGFLEGSSGIALALLDWCGYADTAWNRPLALS